LVPPVNIATVSGRVEVIRRCPRSLRLVVDRGQQPHQQEEGHHGRHEVGVGDLPGAAVVAVAALLDLLDD
jgi:hypothetical protein